MIQKMDDASFSPNARAGQSLVYARSQSRLKKGKTKMIKYLIAAALLISSPALANYNASDQLPHVSNDNLYVAETYAPKLAQATTQTTTQTKTPTEPASVTTTVKGGTLAADVLQWIQVALLPTVGAAIIGLILRGMSLLGIATTSQQSDQLKKIAVEGLNSAFSTLEGRLRSDPRLDVHVKGQIMADAIAYTQEHAKETLSAMGLDPKSGKAVDAIRAKIETALNDPRIPTPDAITPDSAKVPNVNGVVIQGSKA